ncbi:PREDICTED: stress-induced-phosphoprotein 1-like [Priapulus caudatus]|uniref:Stress-induced-phosphoprotein 1-like n=1 Tax=Priapulus caudatus TaxID=37621 RepID=A0ABM1EP57_PRICU|nr:PREDICTED: stress-induced-phosphoprotein 1-like [Priapulus caudatus]
MALCFVLQRILDFCRDDSFFARELREKLTLIIATSEMENFSMSLSPTSLLRFIKLYHGYMFEEIGRQTAWLFPELNPLQTATAVMVTAMSVCIYMLESAVPPIVLSVFKKADDERTQESRRFKDFGNNAFFKKDYSKALHRYTDAIELNPFNHIVYGNRAQVYIEMEKYSSARSDCFRAMLLDETWPKKWDYAEIKSPGDGGSSFLVIVQTNYLENLHFKIWVAMVVSPMLYN